jgi:PAS domain S-box-containing protein
VRDDCAAGGADHHQWEYRIRHKDGSYRWVRDRSVVLRRADGKVYRVAGSREDITDRKTAEEELAHERYLLRNFTDTISDFICFKDRDGRYTHMNPTLFARLGLTDQSQFLGKTVHDLFEPEYARQSQAEEDEIIRTGRPVVARDVTMTWPDGQTTWGSVTKMPLRDPKGQIIGTFAVARDITERKLAEEALRQSEERYRSVIAAMQDGVLVFDAGGSIVSCNAAAERILGLSSEQIMGRSPHDPRWRSVLEDGAPTPDENPAMITLRTGKPFTGAVIGVHKPDGTLTWITVNAQPLFQADGRTLAGVAVSFEDITERKRMEEELRRAEERLARREPAAPSKSE